MNSIKQKALELRHNRLVAEFSHPEQNDPAKVIREMIKIEEELLKRGEHIEQLLRDWDDEKPVGPRGCAAEWLTKYLTMYP